MARFKWLMLVCCITATGCLSSQERVQTGPSDEQKVLNGLVNAVAEWKQQQEAAKITTSGPAEIEAPTTESSGFFNFTNQTKAVGVSSLLFVFLMAFEKWLAHREQMRELHLRELEITIRKLELEIRLKEVTNG